ncbi:hypothetical protein ACGFZH_04850 [Streptomyces zaomyceticus]|uniref:hypothetical protein n=1 Tax=Streptomyces zaomyceticus TaxID=68286 RepID=UPI00371376FD
MNATAPRRSRPTTRTGRGVHPAGNPITAKESCVHWSQSQSQSQTGCRGLLLHPDGAGT